MLDRYARTAATRSLEPTARWLQRRAVTPQAITTTGLVIGLAGCVSVAYKMWWIGLTLFLVNRTLDGLDGVVARMGEPSDFGGFYDLLADFTIYSGFVVGTAIALPDTRLAAVVLLTSYYLSGAAFLAWSSLITNHNPSSVPHGQDRSLRFLPGLAEGTETIVCYTLICILPSQAGLVMWFFAGMVFVTAAQRCWWARTTLKSAA